MSFYDPETIAPCKRRILKDIFCPILLFVPKQTESILPHTRFLVSETKFQTVSDMHGWNIDHKQSFLAIMLIQP